MWKNWWKGKFDPMKSKGVGRFVLENQDLDPEHASYLEAWEISESVGWTPEEAGLFWLFGDYCWLICLVGRGGGYVDMTLDSVT